MASAVEQALPLSPRRLRLAPTLGAIAVAVVFAGLVLAGDGSNRPPHWIQLPIDAIIRDIFSWFLSLSVAGLSTVDVFRALTWAVDQPLRLANGLLFAGFPQLGLGAIPWPAIMLVFGAVGAAGSPRLALLGLLGMLYLATFGLWELSMQTLALVVVAVPLAAIPGLILGVAMARRPRLENALAPLFDLLQSMPQIAYLVPAVVLFGLGEPSAILATAVFATPAMARCVIVGLRAVPAEVVEAGIMTGATPWQLLTKVRLPAAKPSILVGLNQVIMMALAMVVIASLIGAKGLGHEVLIQLDRLRLGRALEVGAGIVVLAVVLDRLAGGLARAAERAESPTSIFRLYRGLGLLAILATVMHAAGIGSGLEALKGSLSTAWIWDGLIESIVANWSDGLQRFRDAFLVWFALPIRQFVLGLPWFVPAAAAGLAGAVLGGWRLAALGILTMLFPAVSGLWVPAMTTVYMISTALLVCIVIGVPLAVAASRSEMASRAVTTACDVLQTLPGFIYLVPFVMLFRVGDVAALAATVCYAIVPLVRYTIFGLRNVSASVMEAGRAIGCTRLQLLFKIEFPLALPHMLLGLNQMILFGLFTLSITALVGSRDLSQTIYRALAAIDPGRGLAAGLCVALFAILADRMLRSVIVRYGSAA